MMTLRTGIKGKITLPDGWFWTDLGEACLIILGQSPSSETYNSDGIGLPFYQGKSEFGYLYPTPVKWCSEPIKIAQAGDVLISVRAPVGPTNLCYEESCIGRGLAAIRPKGDIPNRYVLYYLRFIEKELASKATGTTFSAISGDVLKREIIPLAPLTEQNRIVAKIEELFSQLDAAEAALKRAKANLKRYRQSVLQAAIEGRSGTLNISGEPVEKVLKRVWAERKIKFPAIPFDVAELPSIPENWCWVGIEQLTDGSRNAMKAGPFGSALKKEFYVPTGYKIYGQEQVIKGDPFFGDYYIDAEMFNRLKSCEVKPGDVLVSLVGTIGKVLILPDNIEPGIINPRLVKFSLDSTLINSEYFRLYLESKTAKDYFSIASHGQTMDVLNLGILKKLPIPLPPLNEQKRIIDELQSKFALIEVSDRSSNDALLRISHLRQSILQHAFSGQLLP